MSKLKELLHILRQHNIVTFTLTGLGETIIECSYFDEAVKEFEEYESNKHYIELGKAVEKAFDEGYTLTKNPNKFVSAEIKDALHLFKWHELINIVEKD